jgi:hypothetical protein
MWPQIPKRKGADSPFVKVRENKKALKSRYDIVTKIVNSFGKKWMYSRIKKS